MSRSTHLSSQDKTKDLSLYFRMKMAKDAAMGMAWLHGGTPVCLHRDFKTSNLLYVSKLCVCVRLCLCMYVLGCVLGPPLWREWRTVCVCVTCGRVSHHPPTLASSVTTKTAR